MFCNKCGNYIDENSGVLFCNKCGNDLRETIANIKKSDEKIEEPKAEPVVNQAPVSSEPQNVEIKRENVISGGQVENKKNNSKYIIVAVGVIALLILIAIWSVLMIDNFSFKKSSTNTNMNINTSASSNSSTSSSSSSSSSSSTKTTGKRVGSEKYGYVTVPSSWTEFIDSDLTSTDMVLYSNGSYIVSLYGMDADIADAYTYAYVIYDSLIDDDNVTNVELDDEDIGKYDGYEISCYYNDEKTWLYMWFLDGEDGITHYISIEGPDEDSDYFDDIIDTFSLTE